MPLVEYFNKLENFNPTFGREEKTPAVFKFFVFLFIFVIFSSFFFPLFSRVFSFFGDGLAKFDAVPISR